MPIYVPPTADDVVLEFDTGGYTPPSADDVVLEFSEGGQEIVVSGFDSMEFGTATFRAGFSPVGFDASQFSVFPADFYNKTQIKALQGFDSMVFGRVGVNTRWIDNATVGNTAAFGDSWTSNWVRTILGGGLGTQTTYGSPVVSSGNPVITFIGHGSLVFGTARFLNTNIVRPLGVTTSAYGVMKIENWQRYVYPRGYDFSIVWDPFGPVDPDGGANPGVRHDYKNVITVPGIPPPILEGYPSVSIRNTIRLKGIAPGVVSAPFALSVKKLKLVGFDSLQVGDIDRWEANTIKPYGFDSAVVGVPPAVTMRINLTGLDSAVFGVVRLPRWLLLAGIAPPDVPNPALVAEWGCDLWVAANASAGDQTQFGTMEIA